jgi:phosphoenolpyruvate synthase/pyruvate phosphate dikinase
MHSFHNSFRAARRERLFKQWEDLAFEEMNFGVPKPISNEMASFVPVDSSGATVINGTPVCRGTAKGVARVVTRLSEAKSIQHGDILVTVCTDIAWSPYFPLLGGVVTEIGGLMSHGAVVAREYGLPCIVGAVGATQAFSSGKLNNDF